MGTRIDWRGRKLDTSDEEYIVTGSEYLLYHPLTGGKLKNGDRVVIVYSCDGKITVLCGVEEVSLVADKDAVIHLVPRYKLKLAKDVENVDSPLFHRGVMLTVDGEYPSCFI